MDALDAEPGVFLAVSITIYIILVFVMLLFSADAVDVLEAESKSIFSEERFLVEGSDFSSESWSLGGELKGAFQSLGRRIFLVKLCVTLFAAGLILLLGYVWSLV